MRDNEVIIRAVKVSKIFLRGSSNARLTKKIHISASRACPKNTRKRLDSIRAPNTIVRVTFNRERRRCGGGRRRKKLKKKGFRKAYERKTIGPVLRGDGGSKTTIESLNTRIEVRGGEPFRNPVHSLIAPHPRVTSDPVELYFDQERKGGESSLDS